MEPGWRKNYTRYKAYLNNVVSNYRRRKDVKMYLEIILSLVTVSLFAIFALKPTLETIATLVVDIETKESTLSRLDEKIDALGNANQAYDRELNRILMLSTALPTSAEPADFTQQMETLASVKGNSVISFSLGETILVGKENPAGFKNDSILPENARGLKYSISTTSNYTNLSEFIKDVERMRRQQKINTLTFNTTETKDGKQLLLLIEGDAIYSKETDVIPTQ